MNHVTPTQLPEPCAPLPVPSGRSRTVALAGVALALAVTVAAVGPARLGTGASALFQAYVDAQQRMLAAAGNVTADGRSEFAVLLRDGAGADDLRAAMATLPGVRFERAADLPGWVIVTAAPGERRGLDALIALPQARLVVPNRGLWICH